MRNFSDKFRIKNQNSQFMSNNFTPYNRTVYKMMWKNTVEPDRPQGTI